MQESRSKWRELVMRREEQYVGNGVMVMDVPGKRRNGRLKRRWMASIKHDSTETGSSLSEAVCAVGWMAILLNLVKSSESLR